MAQDVLLPLQGIDKSFPGVKVLSNACLSVYTGRAMVLMGENGAGKSTLMKVLTGFITKTLAPSNIWGGRLRLRDRNIPQKRALTLFTKS